MPTKIPTGSVFQRTYKGADGQVRKTTTWFIRYCIKGRPVCIATGSTDRKEALSLLRQKMAQAPHSAEHSEQIERVVVDQLLDLLIEDYQFNKRGSAYDTELRVNKNIRPFFGKTRAMDVTTPVLKKYTAARSKVAEPATVNKELAHLRRAFHLGLEHEPPLVTKVPRFRMMPVDNVRTGMLTHDAYRAIRDSLPSYARIALVIGYHTGSRKGEIAKIRLDKIDLKAGRIDLPGKTTKNRKARYLPIYGDMNAELSMAMSLADQKKCPFLVQRDGERVSDWEKSWNTACGLAGVDDTLFHDLRRTAVTNMIEAGFTEKEAMEISGHKTRAVFDRYHIVSERRMKQLSARMEAHMRAKELEEVVPVSCTRENSNVH
jgi:integrase